MNTVSIMQPYVFPYVGYLGLISESDTFVLYDDVNYIRRGWINRNNVLINGQIFRFTIPVESTNRSTQIKDVRLHEFEQFRERFKTQLVHGYSKAPYFKQGMEYVNAVVSGEHSKISTLAFHSIKELFNLLEIEKIIIYSSDIPSQHKGANREERLINISKHFNAERYVNAIGGVELYSKENFRKKGMELLFLKPIFLEYNQFSGGHFQPGLSIIDIIMNSPLSFIKKAITSYSLV